MKNKALFISVATLCIVALATVFICSQSGILGELALKNKILTTDVMGEWVKHDRRVLGDYDLPLQMDLNSVISESELIITGEVDEIKPSIWTPFNVIPRRLRTDIVIKVDQVLFGTDPGKKATVRIDKGITDDTICINEWSSDFRVGERVLLFLTRDNGKYAVPDEDYYVLTVTDRSKYLIGDNGIAMCDFDNYFLRVQLYNSSYSYDFDRERIDLDTLPSLIEELH